MQHHDLLKQYPLEVLQLLSQAMVHKLRRQGKGALKVDL
jgi:hypothetical protein